MADKYTQAIEKASTFLESKGMEKPEVGLILGSGLGELANEAENAVVVPYEDIPEFPVSTVEGHAGQLVYGDLGGKKVVAMQGRFHYYEGYDMQEVTFPVRVMKALGVKSLVVTNAAGGVNEDFTPGDLMIITDHINMIGVNPLHGPNNNELGPRFTDMSSAYNKEYQAVIEKVASQQNIDVKKGVYMGFSGPTYETPAEVRMARTLGGDAAGMSTVPEVIVANHAGLKVAGISCITNYAAGMQENLNHDEVVEVTTRVRETFKSLVKSVIENL
ncbi:purine-nucleoside phosphorylase [Alkalibacterium kapii]|uniref:Purine nucleoside phosphorylase n=1 Tax=Alkalibacterium kapii TaxID=426704 RepID=A0A511ATC1_9LACT|nr:purine-nucleoside phosphorylase [Alkalibacterium kapii]GEK90962.1 purine nucleoside phosphorylase [Alkalibacterium kapii]